MTEEEMTKEDAIKFFRKFVAEKEGLSEEEAGAKINKTIEIAEELEEPLFKLSRSIGNRANKNIEEGIKMTTTAIGMLLQPFSRAARLFIIKTLLMEMEGVDQEMEILGKKIEEYKNERGVK